MGGRSPCCERVGLKKGPWTPEEDQKLLAYIQQHGHGSWRALPAKAGLQRCGKSCRLRWTNYLRPDIKRGKFSFQEEQTIIQLHALLGNRWSAIATHLPERTDNEIKNYWNTHLKKRLTKMGIDPVTHRPRNDSLPSGECQSKNAANLSHMAQWESARLEAEARLVRESKLRSTSSAATPFHPSTACWLQSPAQAPHLDVWQGGHPGSTSTAHARSQGTPIDLDSPSSTLSSTENKIPLAGLANMHVDNNNFTSPLCPHYQHQESERFSCDEKECKCIYTAVALPDSRDRMDGFEILSDFGSEGESKWFRESSSINSLGSKEVAGLGFTRMLLHDSDQHNSSLEGCGDSENIAGEESALAEEEEEHKNYWNSILDLLN